jgi:hypothetical protein
MSNNECTNNFIETNRYIYQRAGLVGSEAPARAGATPRPGRTQPTHSVRAWRIPQDSFIQGRITISIHTLCKGPQRSQASLAEESLRKKGRVNLSVFCPELYIAPVSGCFCSKRLGWTKWRCELFHPTQWRRTERQIQTDEAVLSKPGRSTGRLLANSPNLISVYASIQLSLSQHIHHGRGLQGHRDLCGSSRALASQPRLTKHTQHPPPPLRQHSPHLTSAPVACLPPSPAASTFPVPPPPPGSGAPTVPKLSPVVQREPHDAHNCLKHFLLIHDIHPITHTVPFTPPTKPPGSAGLMLTHSPVSAL